MAPVCGRTSHVIFDMKFKGVRLLTPRLDACPDTPDVGLPDDLPTGRKPITPRDMADVETAKI
jgi:hypothetical protein